MTASRQQFEFVEFFFWFYFERRCLGQEAGSYGNMTALPLVAVQGKQCGATIVQSLTTEDQHSLPLINEFVKPIKA